MAAQAAVIILLDIMGMVVNGWLYLMQKYIKYAVVPGLRMLLLQKICEVGLIKVTLRSDCFVSKAVSD